MSGIAGSRAGRLAIVAGGGKLPRYVAEAARAFGENPFILLLAGEASGDWNDFEHASVSIGDVSAIYSLLRDKELKRVVLSGSVGKRPEWRNIRPPLSVLFRLPSIIRTLFSGGDDTVLRMVIDLLESQGCVVVGAHEIAPGLLAATGPIGTHRPDDEGLRDIQAAMRAADVLGSLDIGQGAVSVGGRVIALEGAEGTDNMLLRVVELRRDGRISSRRRGVLVKLCKPGQDMRADLPTIGLSTIEHARAAGLAGIAVEAGRSLLLQRESVIEAANAAGLFVVGIDRDLAGGFE